MNVNKIFNADSEGKLDKFIDKLTVKETLQLIRSFEDELSRYKIFSKNYSKEKFEKYSIPYIKSRQNYINKLVKSYELKTSN